MSPGYQTKQENISVAGVADLQIRSLLDRQQYADPLGAAQALGISPAAWPIFGQLWPSGAQLAARMALHVLVPGQRILEIGCGLALASLVAHRRGADITASDCHPEAEGFLNENLRLNQLAPMKYRHKHWGSGDYAEPSPFKALPPLLYHLIIGSDVLYERDTKGDLAAFIGTNSLPSSQVWIIDPDRGNRSAFNRRMADEGFLFTEQRLDQVATVHAPAYKGRLMTYQR